MNASTPSHRRALQAVAAAPAFPPTPFAVAQPKEPLLEVWKNPQCGCCHDWGAHLQASELRTKVYEADNTAVRAKLGTLVAYRSCHAARVDGYAVEEHVPAAEIRRLLKERPKAIGLAVPGMPVGSPGMDRPAYGGRRDPYEVLLVAKDGTTSVYWSHR